MSQAPAKREREGNTSTLPLRRSKRSQKTGEALFEESKSRPIDILGQVRMTSLCLNRVIFEPDLVRMILKDDAGILMDDVYNRTFFIIGEIQISTRVCPYDPSLLQELVGYLQYYSDSVKFMSAVMRELAQRCWCGSYSAQRDLFKSCFDMIAHATRKNPHELCLYLAEIVQSLLLRHDHRYSHASHAAWYEWFDEAFLNSNVLTILFQMANNIDAGVGREELSAAIASIITLTVSRRRDLVQLLRESRRLAEAQNRIAHEE